MTKTKREKKFKLFKIPRYLPGQVHKRVLVSDLLAYNKHRYNVFVAKPRVDDKPLPMNPMYYLNCQRMLNDAMRLKEIDRGNKELIKKINTINRMGGKVDSFNPVAYSNQSKWRAHELKMKAIVIRNKELYYRLVKVQSLYSNKEMEAFWEEVLNKLSYSCKFPIAFLAQKTLDQIVREQPPVTGEDPLEKIDRPTCFMDFRVKEGVYLGRIIIELYHDFVPVTVQNFLSICCRKNKNKLTYKNCMVHRAVPGEFIETGDITKGNGKGGMSIYGETFAEENHKLKHARAGVLSMIRVGPKVNNSQFSITLKAMEKLDNNRVVFGTVIKGNETLCKISDLGRKFGSPTVPIYINKCGMFIKGKTPTVVKSFKY